MRFTRHNQPDGTESTTIDAWDQNVTWSVELLNLADPAMLRVEGDVIHITVANGWARYRIVSRDERTVESTMLTSFIDGG